MSTAHTVTFDNLGYISSINSVCNNRNRLNIKHPRKDDTFKFIYTATTYKSVRVFIKIANTEMNVRDLFTRTGMLPTAFVPFDKDLTVAHDGNNNEITFHFAPSETEAGSTTDDGIKAPPDTGTIKVGG